MTRRLLLLSACFVATTTYIGFAMQPERVPLREPLAHLPNQLGNWSGHEAAPLTSDVLAVLGVDDYLNRYYVASPNDVVGLYVGYYQSQRQGDTIHSPMNCLPGAGWQPVRTTQTTIAVPGRADPIHVNEVLIVEGARPAGRLLLVSEPRPHRGERLLEQDLHGDRRDPVEPLRCRARAHRQSRSPARRRVSTRPSTTPAQFVQILLPYLDRYLPS